LNLRVHPPELEQRRLFFFDVGAGVVASPVSNGDERLAAYLTMARHLSDENTIEPLAALARHHSADAVRRVALEQLAILRPNERDYFARQAAG
jgi:hypothetical protein